MNLRRTSVTGLAITALVATTVAHASSAPKMRFRLTELQSQGNYGEPSLAITKNGKHIAVCVPAGGASGETDVWFSGDQGRTFGRTKTSSMNGGGDCELDYLPDGTLVHADLEVNDSSIKLSHDFAHTFDQGRAAGIEQDRQWLAHSPDGKTVYLAYHDFAAEGEFYARSTDGGKTWPAADSAIPINNADQAAAPGSPATPTQVGGSASVLDQGGNTFSGPILVSPDGKDVYVLYAISDLGSNTVGTKTPPYGAQRGIVVAHKGAQESSFTNKYAVVSDGTTTNGTGFPWGTIDAAGNVYVLYNSDLGSPGHFHTYYIVSTDRARSWSKPIKVDNVPLSQGVTVFATGAAGAPGVLDVAWYGAPDASSAADKTARWRVNYTQVRGATSAHPTFSRSIVSPEPNHVGDICLNGLLCVLGGDRSLADFFELAIGPDGMAQIAYSDNYAYGHSGHVIYAKQSTGKSAWLP